jgi:hypothetical protein
VVQKPGVAEVRSDVPFLLVARPRSFLLGGSLGYGDCDCGGASVIAVRDIVCAVTGEFTLVSDVDGFGGVVVQIELNVVVMSSGCGDENNGKGDIYKPHGSRLRQY